MSMQAHKQRLNRLEAESLLSEAKHEQTVLQRTIAAGRSATVIKLIQQSIQRKLDRVESLRTGRPAPSRTQKETANAY